MSPGRLPNCLRHDLPWFGMRVSLFEWKKRLHPTALVRSGLLGLSIQSFAQMATLCNRSSTYFNVLKFDVIVFLDVCERSFRPIFNDKHRESRHFRNTIINYCKFKPAWPVQPGMYFCTVNSLGNC